jgi:hypothetical protein
VQNLDDRRGIVKRLAMRPCLLCIAALATVWIGLLLPRSACAQNDRRLVLLEAHAASLSKNARERLHYAIADVVNSRGIELVAKKALSDKLQHCDLPGCLPQIAAATGAIYVLYVDARFAKESFHLAIQLWNTDEGRLLGRDGRDCPICDEQDLWGSAALMTRAMLERALEDAQKPTAASIAAAKPAVAPSPAVQMMPIAPVPPPADPRPGNGVTYAGLGLAVAGLSALGIGIYYWSVDGNCSDATCDYLRDTRKLGLPMTIAGGALLATGGALLVWRLWPGGTSVSLSPSGLRLAGRF